MQQKFKNDYDLNNIKLFLHFIVQNANHFSKEDTILSIEYFLHIPVKNYYKRLPASLTEAFMNCLIEKKYLQSSSPMELFIIFKTFLQAFVFTDE